MKLRVLGCAGAGLPGFLPPAFLVDDTVLFDAGTICGVLHEEEQFQIQHVFLTHAHLDHTRDILALADNIIIKNTRRRVQIISIPEVIQALRLHLFNNIIWPDFSRLPTKKEPVISYVEISPGEEMTVNDLSVTAVPVSHSVPSVGYICRKRNGSSFLYTGDTGPTESIWSFATDLSAIIVEVSFPDALQDMAVLTGHLTPKLLQRELEKLPALPRRVLITHPKPQYYQAILHELQALGMEQIELLNDGNIYHL